VLDTACPVSSPEYVHAFKTYPILGPPEKESGMGGWDGEASWNRDALERIVVLLFALAGMADLAAGAPFLRRRQVLGILSHGEAEARAFVIGMVLGETASADAPESAGDAASLAVRLRALALALCVLLAQVKQSALPGAAGSRARRPSRKVPGPAVRWPDVSAPLAPDTS
jgi:hypothetical protein